MIQSWCDPITVEGSDMGVITVTYLIRLIRDDSRCENDMLPHLLFLWGQVYYLSPAKV